MGSKREIEDMFSWLPPPSTVIEVKVKDAGKSGRSCEIPGSPAMRRPQRNGIDISRLKISSETKGSIDRGKFEGRSNKRIGRSAQDKRTDNGVSDHNVRQISNTYKSLKDNGRRNLQGNDKEKGCKNEQLLGLEEVAKEKQAVSGLEGGNELYLQDNFRLGGDGDDKSSRKESVFANGRVGNGPVEIESILKSRKKSQLNPSQKFLSLSFQNGSDQEDDKTLEDNGAFYARRVKPAEVSELGQRDGASPIKGRKSELKVEKKKGRKNISMKQNLQNQEESLINASQPHDDFFLSSASEDANVASRGKPRKKSVFAQENLGEEPIDVDDIFSRKQSTGNPHERFISISYQKEDGSKTPNEFSPDLRKRGGLYAKKISK